MENNVKYLIQREYCIFDNIDNPHVIFVVEGFNIDTQYLESHLFDDMYVNWLCISYNIVNEYHPEQANDLVTVAKNLYINTIGYCFTLHGYSKNMGTFIKEDVNSDNL